MRFVIIDTLSSIACVQYVKAAMLNLPLHSTKRLFVPDKGQESKNTDLNE